MKKFGFGLLSLALASLALTTLGASSANAPESGVLTFTATGLAGQKGEVRIALYRNAESFEGKKPPSDVGTAPIEDGKARFVFEGMPLGEYAAALFYDKNANGKLDHGMLGKPTESYGFSNNVRGKFGLPPYEKVKFTLTAAGANLEVQLE